MLVDDKEVVDLILLGPEFFEDADVFAGAPAGVDGDVEGGGFVEVEGEFGEDWFGVGFDC